MHTVLEKVQQGVEVVVEQNYRPVAIFIKSSKLKGRILQVSLPTLRPVGSTR